MPLVLGSGASSLLRGRVDGPLEKPDPLQIAAEGIRQGRRWRGAYEATLPVLKQLTPPFGVFAHNACSGWGVYEACRQLGLRIPEDASVVCIDDSDIARAMTPPMTAIAQRTDLIGETAVELLGRRIQACSASKDSVETFTHAVIDVDLIERPSVARGVRHRHQSVKCSRESEALGIERRA